MMWYLDGSWYAGNWIAGRRHGQGVEVQPNGNRYEGGWRKDRRHGLGVLFFLDRGRVQEGRWKRGCAIHSTVEDLSFEQSAPHPEIPPLPTLFMDQTKISFGKKCLKFKSVPALKRAGPLTSAGRLISQGTIVPSVTENTETDSDGSRTTVSSLLATYTYV